MKVGYRIDFLPVAMSMFLLLCKLSPVVSFTSSRVRPSCVNIPSITTRLFSLKSAIVEISPSNHGTTPLNSFVSTDGSIHPLLVDALREQRITIPTPIQAYGIPLLKERYDVMGSAQTGTGKTLMFSLPLCERLLSTKVRKKKGPVALIINPTRELAMQTAGALEQLTTKTSIKIALATGGESVAKQRRQLDTSDIIVGTPGRILQFVDERVLSLASITDCVVDEADRLLDLGFEPDLRRIARALGRRNREERCTVLCSATFPPDVQRIAADFLKQDYYFVAAGRVGATHSNIFQTLKWVDSTSERRRAALQEVKSFLKQNPKSRVIVFCNTKEETERMGAALKGTSVRVVTGDKQQSERNKSLEAFRKGRVQVLVATDVAARGLDVENIALVVQVDPPRDVDTYVHRIGRTGRAGKKGKALALVDGKSVRIAPSLVELLLESNNSVPAWLLGMSYVARARSLEEEMAISAGGGGQLLEVGSTSKTSADEDSNEMFSDQDFRSSADVGSWGSERDTSYHSFDEDAYSSLDSDSDGESSKNLNSVHRITEDDGDTVTEGSPIIKEKMKESNSRAVSFKRQKPSSELRATLKRIDGSDKISKKPSRRILNVLSKRGSNQRLRFEYLGMFPFEAVSDMLMSRENQKFDRSNNDSSKLPRVLMVAEKPSIAKAIADALSGPRGARQKRGISRALPVYEFTSDSFAPVQDTNMTNDKPVRSLVTVTSVVGHIFSLAFDKKDGDGAYSDPSEYFSMPVVKQEEGSTSKLRVVDHLRALAADSDHLVLWLDCDAEGENIGYEVIGVTRRALEQKAASDADAGIPPQRRVHRARFSAITGDALRDAFKDLTEPDAELSKSVDARQELDLRCGVAFTRLLSWRCVGMARTHFDPATKFISYGPCQTPALSFCVDRAREIEAFESEDYWKVQISVDSPDTGRTTELEWIPPQGTEVRSTKMSRRRTRKGDDNTDMVIYEESSTFDETAANRVVQLASEVGSSATITNIESLSETINPPVGLNTVALLAAGSKAMGMSPKKCMQAAEKLYSAGLISYPRTETTRYDPKGFDVRLFLREHTDHPEWGRTASHLLRTKYSKTGRPPIRGHDAGDHPPITCLRAATRDEVGGGAEWRVYEFVVRNFLGSLGDELRCTRQLAELQLDADETHKFKIEKVVVDSVGFAGACRWVLRDIGAENKKDGGNRDSRDLEEGMSLSIVDAKKSCCATRPPRFLQEHELIELMDQKNIGTDVSMATHVNNIVDRGYVVLCDESGALLRSPRPPRPGQKQLPRQIGRYLVPTPLGIGLLDLFDGTKDEASQNESPALLSRPAIRAQMEDEVKQIALGKMDKSECLEHNLDWFEARYNEFVESLTRNRLNDFAKTLRPTKDALRYWQRLGAFEPPQPSQQNAVASAGRRVGAKSKKRSRFTNGKTKHRNRTPAKSRGRRSTVKQGAR